MDFFARDAVWEAQELQVFVRITSHSNIGDLRAAEGLAAQRG
jgi:hypothetical protein